MKEVTRKYCLQIEAILATEINQDKIKPSYAYRYDMGEQVGKEKCCQNPKTPKVN